MTGTLDEIILPEMNALGVPLRPVKLIRIGRSNYADWTQKDSVYIY